MNPYKTIKLFVIIIIFIVIKIAPADAEDNTSHTRLGVRLGTGYMRNHTEEKDYRDYVQLSLGALFNSRYLDVEAYGVTPQSKAVMISALTNIYPFKSFGIGCVYMYTKDDLARDKENSENEFYHKGSYNSLLFGFIYRSSFALRVSFYTGIALSGEICFRDRDKSYYKYEIDNFIDNRPSVLIINAEYYFSNYISAMLSYHQNGGEGKIAEKPAGTMPEDKRYMDTKIIILSIGYSLCFK